MSQHVCFTGGEKELYPQQQSPLRTIAEVLAAVAALTHREPSSTEQLLDRTDPGAGMTSGLTENKTSH